MSWFSFLRKNKLEPAPDESEFYSHAEDIPVTARGRGKAKEEPVDPVLPEKKRARRRLVGAVAITLALVIVLPMVLDAEPKATSGDIVIQIPSRDKVSKLSASRPSASAVALAEPEKTAELPPPASPPPAETAGNAQKPPVEVPAKPTPAKLVQESAKAVKVEAKPAAKPEAKNGNAKPVADAAQGKFVVQVAALATQEKINELQGKLSKAGFKTHTQKVATKDGDRIRVRIGPFASKDEAEKTCPKLSKINLKCTVLSN